MIFTFRIGNWGDRAKLKAGATRWQRTRGTRRKREARRETERQPWKRTRAQQTGKRARAQGQEDEHTGSDRKASASGGTQARGKPPAPPCRNDTQKARRRMDCGESANPRARRSRDARSATSTRADVGKPEDPRTARRFAARQDDERERSGNSRRRRPTGNPMTVSRSPSTRATRSAPAPCTAYAPALSNDSPFRR